MKNGIAKVERFEDYRLFDEIIDVRTPAEFADDHIPGAINCPVLDNEQRIEVGTLYKQHSPFVAKRIGAAYVAQNIAHHLQTTFHDRGPNWKPLIVCWRGGQRSGAMTLIFRRVGWDAKQLQGGYKDYRKQAIARLAELPPAFSFKVICGATGSGKSRLLKSLAQLGAQILDLEELAEHKGSVLGVLPGAAQPSQKMFETRLLAALLALDPARPVYVEAESRKIGTIQLPDAMLEALRGGACINVEATFAARVDFLLRDYAYFLEAPEWLSSRLDVLANVQSRATLARWHDYARTGEWRALVSELLELHYDPLYGRSQSRNFTHYSASQVLATDDLSPAGIEALARHIVAG
jgi:tRNA 2-selenouridine synthase